jgi:hypothetical protein
MQQLVHDKMLGVRSPGGGSSRYIGDISDGDDEDSDQNEESEEEAAAAAGVWAARRCVNTFFRISLLINWLLAGVASRSSPSILIAR